MDKNNFDIEKADEIKVNEALVALEQHNFVEARRLLRQVVANTPDQYVYSYEVDGVLYIKFWSKDEFFQYVTWVEQHHREKPIRWVSSAYPRAYFHLGFIDVEEGQFDNALVHLQDSLKLEPDNPTCLIEMALVYGKIGKHETAISLLDRALQARPWTSSKVRDHALRGKGVELINLNDLSQAQECLLESLKYEPDSEAAFNELSYIGALRMGVASPESIKSVKIWQRNNAERKCLQCGKNLSHPLHDKLRVLNINGNLSFICSTCGADPIYEESIAVNYNYASAYYEEGIKSAQNGHIQEAIEAYKKAITANPNVAEAYVALGLAYTNLENYKEATIALKEAAMIAPEHPNVFYYLGESYFHLQQYLDAAESYRQAIEKNPNHTPSYFSIGGTYLLLGQYGMAIKSYKQAIEIDPNFPDSYFGLGLLYATIGDKKAALEEYKILKNLDPVNADFLLETFINPTK